MATVSVFCSVGKALNDPCDIKKYTKVEGTRKICDFK